MDLEKYTTQWVEIEKIDFDNKEFQFRQKIDVKDLIDSFQQEGQKFPVVLWKRTSGNIQIISGFRRITAAKHFNWTKILAIVIPEADLSQEEALKLNFIENIERKSLTDIDIIYASKKLSDQG